MNQRASRIAEQPRAVPDAALLAGVLIGESTAMRSVRETIARVAGTRIPVLIEGPTGSGKELVAQALHALSGRDGKLVAVNACAIPDTMFEDTLFGHARGSFTGAQGDTIGLFAEAHGGTIFLDEISGLPLTLQPKLLRVLETGRFRPIGAREDAVSDFRVVSATNVGLSMLERHGRFRSDLRHRLANLTITIQPLRQRVGDIPLLARHFLAAENPALTIDDGALALMGGYPWPGNVRELRSVVECASAMTTTGRIDRELVAHHLGCKSSSHVTQHPRALEALLALLDDVEWDVDAAAERLGVHRATVYRRIQRLDGPHDFPRHLSRLQSERFARGRNNQGQHEERAAM